MMITFAGYAVVLLVGLVIGYMAGYASVVGR